MDKNKDLRDKGHMVMARKPIEHFLERQAFWCLSGVQWWYSTYSTKSSPRKENQWTTELFLTMIRCQNKVNHRSMNAPPYHLKSSAKTLVTNTAVHIQRSCGVLALMFEVRVVWWNKKNLHNARIYCYGKLMYDMHWSLANYSLIQNVVWAHHLSKFGNNDGYILSDSLHFLTAAIKRFQKQKYRQNEPNQWSNNKNSYVYALEIFLTVLYDTACANFFCIFCLTLHVLKWEAAAQYIVLELKALSCLIACFWSSSTVVGMLSVLVSSRPIKTCVLTGWE